MPCVNEVCAQKEEELKLIEHKGWKWTEPSDQNI